MADNSDLSDLMLVVGGDITPLEDALAEIPSVLQQAGDGFDVFQNGASMLDSLTEAVDNATEGIESLDPAIEQMADQFFTLQENLEEAQEFFGLMQEAFEQGSVGAGQLQVAAEGLTDAFEALYGSGAELTPTLESIGQEFANLQGLLEEAQQNFILVSEAFQQNAASAGQLAASAAELQAAYTALNGSAESVPVTLQSVNAEYQNLQASLVEAQANLATVTAAFEANAAGVGQVTAAAAELESAYTALNGATDTAVAETEAFTVSMSELAQGFIAFQLLKGFIEDTVTAFGDLQRASTALAAITGDTEGASIAMSQLNGIADQLGLTIDQVITAQQKLAGLGIELTSIPPILQALAEGAIGAGVSFDSLAQKFDQIVLTGTLSARSLNTMKLSMSDVADAMNMTGAPAAVVTASFKNISDQSERAAVLTAALTDKFGALSSTLGNDVTAAWTKVSNAATDAYENMGKEIGPTGLMALAQDAILAIKGIATAIIGVAGVASVMSDYIDAFLQSIGIGMAALALAVGNAIQGNFAQAVQDLKDGFNTIQATTSNVTQEVQQDWTRTTTLIGDLWDQTGNVVINKSATMVGGINEVNTATAKFNATFQMAAQKAIDAFTTMNDESGDTSASLKQINAVLETASLNWAKLNQGSKDFVANLKEAKDEAQAAFNFDQSMVQVDKIQDAVEKLGDEAGLTLAKIPPDFQTALAAVANGQSFTGLDNQITSQIAKIQQMIQAIDTSNMTQAQALVATDAINVGNATIANLQQAKANIDAINGALKLLGQDTAISKLGDQIQGFVTQANLGKENTDQINLSLGNLAADLTKTVIPSLQAGATVTPKFVEQLMSLNDVAPGLGTALAKAATEGVQPFTAAVLDWQAKIPATVATVNAAFKSLGSVSLDQAQNNVTTYGNDVKIALSGVNTALQQGTPAWNSAAQVVIGWGNKVVPTLVQFGGVISSAVIDKIALISPAVAQAITQGPDALQAAIDKLATQTQIASLTMTKAFQLFGETSANSLQNTVDLEQAGLNYLIQQGAPMQQILQAQVKMLQNQQSLNQLTDMTGQSELAVAMNISQAQLQLFAFSTATMGLANAWNSLSKAFVTAWDGMEKGIADAIVSGQNFGAAMTKVFDDLKQAIVELVVKYLLDQYLAALITLIATQNGWNLSMITTALTAKTTAATTTAAMATASTSMASAATAMTVAATSMAASAATMAASFSGAAGAVAGSTAATATSVTAANLDIVADEDGMAIDYGAAVGTVTAANTTFAASTTASMATAATATTAAATSMVASMTAITGALGSIAGAIAGIIGDIEQAHTNTLLDRVANNTLGILNVSLQILTTTQGTWQQMQSLVALMWNPIETLLFDISSSLDDIKSDTASMMTTLLQLAAAGATTGGGGNAYYDIEQAANAAAVAQENAANQISTAADSLTDSAASISYAGTAITSGANVLTTTASTAAVAIGVMAAVAASVSPQAAQALSSGGIGAGLSGVTITPVGSYTGPVGAGVAGGVGSGAVNLTVNVQAGVVAGQNGMQQLATMVGQTVVTNLRRNVSLLKA